MPEIVARGVRFNVQTIGRGDPPVVLVHGFGMDNSSSQYFMLAPALSPSLRVVCYDLRGHGMSDVPPTGYTLADHVSDLAAILDGLGLGAQRVGLVGTSMGGRIALAFALRFPERTSSVVLLDSELDTSGEQLDELARTVARGRRVFEQRLQQAWEEFLEEHTGPDGGLDHDASLLKTWVESKRDVRRKLRMGRTVYRLLWQTSFIQDLRAEPPFDWESLRRVRCPVLALYGDASITLETGRRVARTVPDCTLELVPDCGHFVIYKTDHVRDALRRWFVGDEQAAAARGM